VLINPLSGKKKAEGIYQKYLGPLFDAIGVKVSKKGNFFFFSFKNFFFFLLLLL